MASADQIRQCSNPGCQVSKTGICIEGNTPSESCPFFGQSIEESSDDYESEVSIGSLDSQDRITSATVTLHSGEALSPVEMDLFLRRKAVKFVTIVGEQDSGKTTLICSLYDKFLRGCFAGYLFAGSQTLVGFEKKIHHSRIDSGRNTPETLRTSLSDGLKFFHLSLAPQDLLGSRIEIMISDRAGENYQAARNNTGALSDLTEVGKAHYVVLLLDGGRMATPVHRANAMQGVRQTLRAFLDGGALSTSSYVQIVTTKFDLLHHIIEDKTFAPQLEIFHNQLKHDFANRLGKLTFWNIAARDPHSIFPPGFGVDDLLKSWCEQKKSSINREPLKLELITEFDRLLSRTPMGE